MKAKKAASLLLLMVLILALAYYLAPPSAKPGGAAKPPPPSTGSGYHSQETPKTPPATGCQKCHKGLPHGKNPQTRAFLNLHVHTMACQACHADLSGLTPAREGGQKTGLIKINYQDGKTVGEPEVAGRVHTYPGGARFLERGPACQTCHARYASFLAAPGLFDDYRKRILEDLDVTPHLERGQ